MWRRSCVLGFLALAVLAVAVATPNERVEAAAPVPAEGEMTDLGLFLPQPDHSSSARAINDAGEVVVYGRYSTSLYSAGAMHSLGNIEAFDINNAGQIVGGVETPPDMEHPFLYSGGVLHVLDLLPHRVPGWGIASAINEVGQVVGSSYTSACPPGHQPPCNMLHAFLYSGGVMHDLDTDGRTSRAYDINDAGQVVVQTESRGAFLYSGGAMHALPFSAAYGINNGGEIVGCGGGHALRYSGGVMHDLGTLGGESSCASAINEAGQVVGWADTADGTSHAFLYSNGVMYDLDTLGGDYSTANDINEAGQVVGWADTADGMSHAFLYEPGPPAGANLLISKLASKDKVFRGDTFQYQLLVSNLGPSEATDVLAADGLPEGVSYLDDDCGGGATEQAWSATISSLGSGDTATCNISVEVAEDATGPLLNSASVTSAVTDPDPSNNTSAPVEVEIWSLVYFALGDSVASGHGLPGQTGTCLRAPGAYPRLVFSSLSTLDNRYQAVLDGGHYACSGATSYVEPDGPLDFPEQVDSVLEWIGELREEGPTAALVSVTIGANDFDFPSQSLTGRGLCRPDYQDWADATADQVGTNVTREIERLLAAEDLYVVVTDYHNPYNARSHFFALMKALAFSPVGPGPGNPQCVRLTKRELYARTEYIVHRLNEAIAAAAEGHDPAGLVAVASVHQDFHGHESPRPWCGSAPPRASDSWVQYPTSRFRIPGLNGDDCFHPNADGHDEFAEAVSLVARELLSPQ